MLAIAREMNLSETAFVRRSAIADFGARYFTPAEEIPLAGHPTIATTYALIDTGRLKLNSDFTTITLDLSMAVGIKALYLLALAVHQIAVKSRSPIGFARRIAPAPMYAESGALMFTTSR